MNNRKNIHHYLTGTGMKKEAVHDSCEQLYSFSKVELSCRGNARVAGYMGSGNRSANIMIISDRPSQSEQATKIVGFADYATIITVMLNQKGIRFRDAYWTLAVKEDTEAITAEMIERHKATLRYEITDVAPSLIITLGSAPITSIMDRPIHLKKATTKYGYNITDHLDDVPILALPHPRTVLFDDDETFKEYFRRSWKLLKKLLD